MNSQNMKDEGEAGIPGSSHSDPDSSLELDNILEQLLDLEQHINTGRLERTGLVQMFQHLRVAEGNQPEILQGIGASIPSTLSSFEAVTHVLEVDIGHYNIMMSGDENWDIEKLIGDGPLPDLDNLELDLHPCLDEPGPSTSRNCFPGIREAIDVVEDSKELEYDSEYSNTGTSANGNPQIVDNTQNNEEHKEQYHFKNSNAGASGSSSPRTEYNNHQNNGGYSNALTPRMDDVEANLGAIRLANNIFIEEIREDLQRETENPAVLDIAHIGENNVQQNVSVYCALQPAIEENRADIGSPAVENNNGGENNLQQNFQEFLVMQPPNEGNRVVIGQRRRREDDELDAPIPQRRMRVSPENLRFTARVVVDGTGYLWGERCNRLYVDNTKNFTMEFYWNEEIAACLNLMGLSVRATVLFDDPADVDNIVTRCAQHEGVGGVLSAVCPESEVCANGVHHAVRVPVRCGQRRAFRFHCRNSCPSGIRRRLIYVLFELINDSGFIYGEQRVDVQVGPQIRRTMQGDEEVLAQPGAGRRRPRAPRHKRHLQRQHQPGQ